MLAAAVRVVRLSWRVSQKYLEKYYFNGILRNGISPFSLPLNKSDSPLSSQFIFRLMRWTLLLGEVSVIYRPAFVLVFIGRIQYTGQGQYISISFRCQDAVVILYVLDTLYIYKNYFLSKPGCTVKIFIFKPFKSFEDAWLFPAQNRHLFFGQLPWFMS